MSRLRRNISIIKSLNSLSPKQFKAVIQNSDKDLLFCLSNIIRNVNTGAIRVSPAVLKKLRRFRKDIYQLCTKRLSLKKRKHILVQNGGAIFSTLLPIILGSLIGLVTRKRK